VMHSGAPSAPSSRCSATVSARWLPQPERPLLVDPEVLDIALPLSGKAAEGGYRVLPGLAGVGLWRAPALLHLLAPDEPPHRLRPVGAAARRRLPHRWPGCPGPTTATTTRCTPTTSPMRPTARPNAP
jgi:hypothetical protein